jgi:hypothetical protein
MVVLTGNLEDTSLSARFGVKSFLAVVEQQVKNAAVWGLFWVAFAKCVVGFVLVAVK